MCGIFGYISSRPANIEKIKALGMYNATRGTDACGIIINDKAKKGINGLSNWVDFCEQTKLNTYEEHKNKIILGHTRNASNKLTKSDEECAHPIVIKTKKGKVKIVGVHNGVIDNHKELANKFKVSEGKIDSITLMDILSDKNNISSVLEQYEGAAALMWYYPEEPNILYIFKGGKRNWNQELIEERPLYYYTNEDKDTYFSSIKESLYYIGGEINTVKTVPLNQLLIIEPNKKIVIKPIDRKFSDDSRNITPWTDNNVNSNTNTKCLSKNLRLAQSLKDSFKNYVFSKISQNPKVGYSDKILIENEPWQLDQLNHGAKITFWKGRYTRNGHPVGQYDSYVELDLDIYGFDKDHSDTPDELNTYCFWKGYLFRSKEHAEAYFKNCKEISHFQYIYNNVSTKKELNLDNLSKYCFGLITKPNDSSGVAKYSTNGEISSWYSGIFTPMFDYNRIYNYNSGEFKSAEILNDLTLECVIDVLKLFDKSSKLSVYVPINKPLISLPNVKNISKNDNNEKIKSLIEDLYSSFEALLDEIEKGSSFYTASLPFLKNIKKTLFKKFNRSSNDEKSSINSETGIIYS